MSGVVHIITQLERGGAQRNTLETVARLHHPGRPQLLWTGQPGALDDEARKRLGGRLSSLRHLVHDANPTQDALALVEIASELARAVERLRAPVVVHTHSTKAGVLGRLAARAVPGVRIVHTVHGFGFDALGENRRWLVEGAERIAGRATDVALFVSEADEREARRLSLFPRARTEVIRSGIDPDAFAGVRTAPARDAARARFGIEREAVVALAMANFKPQKDPLFHVEVLAAWRALEPNACVLFCGDGPLRDAALARARALGVECAFVAPGFLEDTSAAYAAADVALLCSRWEGLPRSVLEATAAGMFAVVRESGWASDLGWARHLRRLAPTATARDVAAALVAAMAATRSQKRVSRLPREFTLSGMLEALSRLYDDLAGPPAPSADERFAMRRRPRPGRRR